MGGAAIGCRPRLLTLRQPATCTSILTAIWPTAQAAHCGRSCSAAIGHPRCCLAATSSVGAALPTCRTVGRCSLALGLVRPFTSVRAEHAQHMGDGRALIPQTPPPLFRPPEHVGLECTHPWREAMGGAAPIRRVAGVSGMPASLHGLRRSAPQNAAGAIQRRSRSPHCLEATAGSRVQWDGGASPLHGRWGTGLALRRTLRLAVAGSSASSTPARWCLCRRAGGTL